MKGISIYVRKNDLRSVVVVVDDFDPRPIYSVVDQMKKVFHYSLYLYTSY